MTELQGRTLTIADLGARAAAMMPPAEAPAPAAPAPAKPKPKPKPKPEKRHQVAATARKLKVTMLLDPAPFADMPPVADSVPPRTMLSVQVAGRTVRADIATRSLRRALVAIREHGPDGVALVLQGSLAADGTIEEAGLAAQPKAKPAEQPTPAAEEG